MKRKGPDKTKTIVRNLLNVFKAFFPLDGEAPISIDRGVSPNVFPYRLKKRDGGTYEGFVLLDLDGELYLTPPVVDTSSNVAESLNRKLYQIATRIGVEATVMNNGSLGRTWVLFRPRSLAYALRHPDVRQLYHSLTPKSVAISDAIFWGLKSYVYQRDMSLSVLPRGRGYAIEIAHDAVYSSPDPGPDTPWKPAWPYISIYMSKEPGGVRVQVREAKLGVYPQEMRNLSDILMDFDHLDHIGERLRFLLFDYGKQVLERAVSLAGGELIPGLFINDVLLGGRSMTFSNESIVPFMDVLSEDGGYLTRLHNALQSTPTKRWRLYTRTFRTTQGDRLNVLFLPKIVDWDLEGDARELARLLGAVKSV